jgi:hypothetical protein
MVLLCDPRIKTSAFRASGIGNPPFERGMGTLSNFGCELRTSTKEVRHVFATCNRISLINFGLCEPVHRRDTIRQMRKRGAGHVKLSV